ncbi:unnamed protein product, partial [Polarella glacialis]
VYHNPDPPGSSLGEVVPPQAMNPLWKTRMCSFAAGAGCRHGRLCTFAHGREELRSAPDFTRTSICPELLKSGQCHAVNSSCPYAHTRQELRPAPGLMKTRMCDFHRKGTCIADGLCRFAHQVDELSGAASAFMESSGMRPGEPILEAEAIAASQELGQGSKILAQHAAMSLPPPPPLPRPVGASRSFTSASALSVFSRHCSFADSASFSSGSTFDGVPSPEDVPRSAWEVHPTASLAGKVHAAPSRKSSGFTGSDQDFMISSKGTSVE